MIRFPRQTPVSGIGWIGSPTMINNIANQWKTRYSHKETTRTWCAAKAEVRSSLINYGLFYCHIRQWTMPNMHTMQIVQHIWHWIAAYLALYGCTIGIMCLYNMFGHSWDDRSGLVTRETLYLVWSLGWRLVWFGHLGDAWSGLVTRVTLGLVWSLGRRLVWFGHSGDAWSGLVTRVTLGLVWSLGWCQRLRDDNCQNIVWFQLLRRRCLIWPTQETHCPGDITQET